MRTLCLVTFLILFGAIQVQAQCDPALIVPDDGTGIPTPIIISEINPGVGGYIEVFNPGLNPVNVNGWFWCSPFNYAALGNVNVAAGSYRTFPWPGNFNDTDAGGEIQLFDSANFGNNNDIIDFVCWGVNPHGTRKGQAEAVGKWIGPNGPCAPALVNGAIHRLNDTPGTSAASYDVTGAPSPMNCTVIPTGIGKTPSHPSIALSIGPNPFSALATIEYTLSSAAEVNAEVFSVTGARVRRLHSGSFGAGTRRILWDGKNDAGRALPSGTYFVKISANSSIAAQRVTIVR